MLPSLCVSLQKLVETQPRPVLVFRCLLQAHQEYRTATIRVVVVAMLQAIAVRCPPWHDVAAMKGFVLVVKVSLPKSIAVLLRVCVNHLHYLSWP